MKFVHLHFMTMLKGLYWKHTSYSNGLLSKAVIRLLKHENCLSLEHFTPGNKLHWGDELERLTSKVYIYIFSVSVQSTP